MLKTRIIPAVLLREGQLVKSVGFKDYRTVGHLTSTVRIYNAREVDELIILDISARGRSGPGRLDLESIEDLAAECFMPLTIGGGLASLEDMQAVLDLGADKVSINTAARQNPPLIAAAAKRFGSQCVVCAIDVRRVGGRFCVLDEEKGPLDIDPLALALEFERLGAGELLLTSADRDGGAEGYELELLRLFKNKLSIPLIINGGLGQPSHAPAALAAGADALAGAYIFHFTQYTPAHIRSALAVAGYAVRGGKNIF